MMRNIVVIYMDLVLHMCRMVQDMKVWQVIKTIIPRPLWTILIQRQQTHRMIHVFFCILQSAPRKRIWQHFHWSNTLWQLRRGRFNTLFYLDVLLFVLFLESQLYLLNKYSVFGLENMCLQLKVIVWLKHIL